MGTAAPAPDNNKIKGRKCTVVRYSKAIAKMRISILRMIIFWGSLRLARDKSYFLYLSFMKFKALIRHCGGGVIKNVVKELNGNKVE